MHHGDTEVKKCVGVVFICSASWEGEMSGGHHTGRGMEHNEGRHKAQSVQKPVGEKQENDCAMANSIN